MANTLTSSGGAAAALVFESTTFEVIHRNDQPWLKAADLARALGYSRSDKITRLFDRNSAEFTDSMTAVVETPTLGLSGNLVSQTRIFSLRGAHLLAMFARTAIAALFRKWVLDILDGQAQATRPMLVSTQTLDYNRISAAQAQHLKELVQLIVESGKQNHSETWSRLHRKMKVNSYLELSAAQFDTARAYLVGKMDGQSIAAIAKKHFPQLAALSAPDQALTTEQANTLRDMLIDAAKAMPKDLQAPLMQEGCMMIKRHFKVDYCEIPQAKFAEAVALVSRYIAHWLQTKMPTAAPTLVGRRWLVSYDAQGREVVELVPEDALIVTPDELPQLILRRDSPISNDQALKIAAHSNLRMMGEVIDMKASSDIERLRQTVRNLGAGDLIEITTQGFSELAKRTALTNELAVA